MGRVKLKRGFLGNRNVAFLIVATVLLVPIASSNTQIVFGQFVGLICSAPTSATACPPPPSTVTGSVGSQLSIPVLIQGSDVLNGFDITLKTNHTTLIPGRVSLNGSILPGGNIVVECVGSSLKVGPGCSPTDTVDTIHLALVGPLLGLPPITGLLFTAIFNVTSSVTTSIAFQTGCNASSVIGTSTCVLISNGTVSNPSVTVQGETYTAAPSPTFTIASSRAEISLGKGQIANSTIFISSLNSFTGTVTFSTTFSPMARHPPSFSVTPSSIFVNRNDFSTATFVVSTANNTDKITYNITITGSGGGVVASLVLPVTVLPGV